MSDSLVKKAHVLYQDGKFEEAKTLYQALNQALELKLAGAQTQ